MCRRACTRLGAGANCSLRCSAARYKSKRLYLTVVTSCFLFLFILTRLLRNRRMDFQQMFAKRHLSNVIRLCYMLSPCLVQTLVDYRGILLRVCIHYDFWKESSLAYQMSVQVQLYLNDDVNTVNCFGLFVCIIVVNIVLLVRLPWAWTKTTWSAFENWSLFNFFTAQNVNEMNEWIPLMPTGVLDTT